MKISSCRFPDLAILHSTKLIAAMQRSDVIRFVVLLLGFVQLSNADNYALRLPTFRFHPLKNSSCYQVYTSADEVDGLSCKKPHEEIKRSCVTEIKGNDNFCEISTPSGEHVKVPCTTPTYPPTDDSPDLDYSYAELESKIECYEVYKNGSDTKELCPKVFPNLATGIVTPDGYTILLQSKLCRTYKSKAEIIADKQFTSSFNFDPEERSCYRFYTPNESISSYNCYDNNEIYISYRERVYTSCVETWEKNDKCSVVKSQNNETVILDCEGKNNTKPNCLGVYKDGNTTEVCMEVLAEGCMGITTPSGLRMLFACRICRPYKGRTYRGSTVVTYDKEMLRRRRKFIKTYLKNELEGRNSYYRNYFLTLINGDVKKPLFPSWLPNTNCYGLALDFGEKLLFKCTDREMSKPGCFKVTNSNGKNETDICAFIHYENCVNVKTPKGNQIILTCYDEQRDREQSFLKKELQDFKNGIYNFHDSSKVIKNFYKIENDCKQTEEDYQTQWLPGHQCWGTVTPDLETILLECPNNKNKIRNGCFQVYTQTYGSDNQILPSSYEVYETCSEIINDLCVGVVTRKGWHIQLSCHDEE